MYNVQWDLVSAFDLSLRSSGQPQRGAQGPTPDHSQYTGQGVWLETYTCSDGGETRGNSHEHGENT